MKVEAGNRISYLKFNISGLSGIVRRATLQLQESGDVGTGTLRVYRGSHNNWTETTLSSANAPIENGQVGVFTGAISTNQFVDIDITPLITGNGIYSIVIKMDTGGNDVWFGSEESEFKPSLSIETRTDIDYTKIPVLQGSGYTWTKFYVAAVTNNVMFKTSNIVGWPTNQHFVNEFKPLVLFHFEEEAGTNIHDSASAFELSPLKLSLTNASSFQWSTNVLKIVTPTVAQTTNFQAHIARLKTANAITVEAWISPSSVTQSGPARIISSSKGWDTRNFTLGVEKTNYVFRLRTTTNDTNGQPEFIATNTAVARTTHVVFTRDTSGQAKFYINNVLKTSGVIGGNFSNWDDSYPLLLFNEGNQIPRPWLGTVYVAAIYDRALSADEVSMRFNNIPSRGDFKLKLTPMPLGPPMYYTNRPVEPPQLLRMIDYAP
jgi:hypothetical protein